MQFQAYQTFHSSSVGQKAGKMSSLSRINDIFHGGYSSVVPVAILSAACSLVIYQQITATNDFHLSMRSFLTMMVVSMAPLALLEKRLLSCSDPLGLLYKFSGKVVLMQTIQLTLRVASGVFLEDFEHGYLSTNLILLASALAMLPTIFNLRPTTEWFVENRDVLLLAALALLIAAVMAVIDEYNDCKSRYGVCTLSNNAWSKKRINFFMVSAVTNASDYLELVSFLPAVLMVCRNKELKEVDVNAARQRAAALIVFLLSFYVMEDIVTGACIAIEHRAPLPALAHTAHFLLVVDFALYFAAHLYDPEKFDQIICKISDWLEPCYNV